MIQGALEADGRLATKNATKIRGALSQVVDFKRVFNKYQETHPQPSDFPTQDRVRARSWILLNIYINDEPLKSAVMQTWAEAYVLGQAAAGEWIKKTMEANKAADDGYIDWQHWKPGDQATALRLRPTGGFTKYLQMVDADSYFKKFNKETIENMGTALSDSIAAGLDAERAAVMIGRHVASASRALTIAITEQNRAMSFGSIQRYKEAELEKMEWHVSDPCPKCAQNSGVVIPIGSTFPSGNTQPPAHPHCRCVLLPVIPGMEEPPLTGATLVDVPPAVFPTPKQQIEAVVQDLQKPKPVNEGLIIYDKMNNRPFEPGKWEVVPREAMREVVIQNIIRSRVTPIDRNRAGLILDLHGSRIDKSFIEKGVVYKNGPIEVQFGGAGLKVSAAAKQEVIDEVEKLQINNPKSQAVVHIDRNSKGKYGWAYLGQKDLWVTPEVVSKPELGAAEKGKFKMPTTAATTQLQYTLTHEWGHLIDEVDMNNLGAQTLSTTEAIKRIKSEFPNEFKSGYSGKNTREFYAEMFTEYYRTEGLTPNALVQAMAKEFNWKAPTPKVAPVPPVAPAAPVAFPVNKPNAKNIDDWNRDEIIKLSKIKDNVAQPTKIWNGPENQYINAWRQIGDPRLKAILEAQGFAKTPTVVTAAQYEALVKQGGIKVYRGVTETTDLTTAQMIDQFKNGDMFVGTGVIGNGVYAGTDLNYVIKYAGDKSENVMELIFSPKAKFIDAKEAEKGARELSGAFYDAAFGRQYSNPELGKIVDSYIEKLGGVPGSADISTVYQNELRELGWLYHDPGAYAATHGYDAIRSIDDDGGVYVILNRGAMVVKE